MSKPPQGTHRIIHGGLGIRPTLRDALFQPTERKKKAPGRKHLIPDEVVLEVRRAVDVDRQTYTQAAASFGLTYAQVYQTCSYKSRRHLDPWSMPRKTVLAAT